jgi:hypothetical protein
VSAHPLSTMQAPEREKTDQMLGSPQCKITQPVTLCSSVFEHHVSIREAAFHPPSERAERVKAEGGRMLPRNILHLNSLYDFVYDHRKIGADGLRLKGSTYGKEYCRRCKVMTESVNEVAGFYVWGRYDRKCCWRSIYFGKAGYKKKRRTSGSGSWRN